jgi:hypothetical protein
MHFVAAAAAVVVAACGISDLFSVCVSSKSQHLDYLPTKQINQYNITCIFSQLYLSLC